MYRVGGLGFGIRGFWFKPGVKGLGPWFGVWFLGCRVRGLGVCSSRQHGVRLGAVFIRTAAVITIWGFPKIRGTLLGVPIIRIIVSWGSILGSPYFGKLPFRLEPVVFVRRM